ncbi:hypothetical protein DSO57_1001192 [Entomophthora muscae]|uniref:Uncharacterized protein n=1 Tax=Entomophthora muscae TaxID=34485 RepID=A0ACC2TWG4_9FUNG|nr:hypothetical protein DSO57_1001192 [Entomophthora muscae]
MMKLVFLVFGVLAQTSRFNSEKGKFQFELTCDQGQEKCEKAKQCFLLSTRFIENALDISTPITVQASYSRMNMQGPWGSPYLLGNIAL